MDDLQSFHCKVGVVQDYNLALTGPMPVDLVKQSVSRLGAVLYIHDHISESHRVVVQVGGIQVEDVIKGEGPNLGAKCILMAEGVDDLLCLHGVQGF